MKKIVSIFLIFIMLLFFVSCGDTKKIEGVEYDTYGFINEGDNKNLNIKYRLVIGNVIWSLVLIETIVAPIYFFGFSLYEPIRMRDPKEPKGSL